ncbi:hypothetical protein, partial [Massilia sp. TWP1-3-3]|uniref:hypothetical protein n=1 Tax=Massilia sp. TWP1-3-3 TaxID=2804573 RepID=UPI003CFB78C5
MRRTFALMTAALVLTFVSFSAAAQSREVVECEHQMNERGAAMAARDWVSMEKFANVFIKKCQRAATSIDISKAYWESSVAAEQLGRPAAALKYIDGCISVAYSNGTCHVQKVLVLKGMKRTEEARRLIAPTCYVPQYFRGGVPSYSRLNFRTCRDVFSEDLFRRRSWGGSITVAADLVPWPTALE